MAEETHAHGDMDTTTQEQTFDGFVHMVARGAILCIVVLIFMALVNG